MGKPLFKVFFNYLSFSFFLMCQIMKNIIIDFKDG